MIGCMRQRNASCRCAVVNNAQPFPAVRVPTTQHTGEGRNSAPCIWQRIHSSCEYLQQKDHGWCAAGLHDPRYCTETVSCDTVLKRQQEGLAPAAGFMRPNEKLFITEERTGLMNFTNRVLTAPSVLCTTQPLGKDVRPTWSGSGKFLFDGDMRREVWPKSVSEWTHVVCNPVYMGTTALARYEQSSSSDSDDGE